MSAPTTGQPADIPDHLPAIAPPIGPAVDVLARYKPTGRGNVYMSCEGFGVSYNANPGSNISFFAGDNGCDETALCVGRDFYILNGDFRREYAKLAESGGLEACLQFFVSKPDLVSTWSDPINAALTHIGGAA